MKQENDALKRDLAAALVAAQEQRALADRARGLEQLLELRARTSLKTTAAEIIGAAATPAFRTVTIDKGLERTIAYFRGESTQEMPGPR